MTKGIGSCEIENADSLDGYGWVSLLKDHPEYADRCDWEKLYEREAERPGYSWFGGDWADLLIAQPQFADQCDWKRLHAHTWARLLRVCPQFSTGCPWEKFDGYDWTNLLAEQPQFACQCDWEKMNGWAWSNLLAAQPQFEDKCTKWDEIGVYDWPILLKAQPQFAKYKEEADRQRQARADAEKKLKKATKSRKPSKVTLEDFQKAVVGLDSSEAAVIMNVSCGEDDEVTYDCDLRGPHGTVVVSGSFKTDDDGKIVSIGEPGIDGSIHSQDDRETVFARLLRRFQGERAFTPKDSPSMRF